MNWQTLDQQILILITWTLIAKTLYTPNWISIVWTKTDMVKVKRIQIELECKTLKFFYVSFQNDQRLTFCVQKKNIKIWRFQQFGTFSMKSNCLVDVYSKWVIKQYTNTNDHQTKQYNWLYFEMTQINLLERHKILILSLHVINNRKQMKLVLFGILFLSLKQ